MTSNLSSYADGRGNGEWLRRGYTLLTTPTYKGLSVQTTKGPLILQYVDKLYDTLVMTWEQYSRFIGIRWDLRLPDSEYLPGFMYTNMVMTRFIESFKAKIRHNRAMALRAGVLHDCIVRYCWAREYGNLWNPHWHGLFLLNGQAFKSLGYIDSEKDNMCSRLLESCASALKMEEYECKGLLNFDRNFRVHTVNGLEDWAGFDKLFEVGSYLCKAYSKRWENGVHNFDTSRI